MVGLDFAIYGVMLVVFIIFLPKGITGEAVDWWRNRQAGAASARGPA